MLLLSLLSLVVGTIFFLYAIKYVAFIAVILLNRVWKRNNGNHNGNGSKGNGNGIIYTNGGSHYNGIHIRSHPLIPNNNWGNEVNAALGKTSLDGGSRQEPFVSIHLPMYNEKNVADRLLKACTSLDYRNYEVIVVDDSTDETIQVLEKWAHEPKVKIIHREVRSGFKGGALNEALKNMDSKAQYVIVFDADFIPQPDIIRQFLVQFNGNGYHNGVNGRNSGNGNGRNGNGKNGNGYNNVAAVQGYQWHCLNEDENWVTRGIRAEYSGSYMIERPCQEYFGLMKMVAGSVYMIKADVLRKYGWTTSITEDWELTLRLYADGYKVLYTPLIAVPAECPSTIERLIRQRMRWSEGHTANVKKHLKKILSSSKVSLREKFEFLYYAPYYLQSVLFLVGGALWITLEISNPGQITDIARLIVIFNFISVPLMNIAGLFLEGSTKRSFKGILSSIVLPFILAPFQAYSSFKGLLIGEGNWVRTYKTGKITKFVGTRGMRWVLTIRRLLRGRRKWTKRPSKPS